MINYIQGNQNLKKDFTFIVNQKIFNDLKHMFGQNEEITQLEKKIKKISFNYQVDIKTIFKLLVIFIIKNNIHLITSKFIDDIYMIFHIENVSDLFTYFFRVFF